MMAAEMVDEAAPSNTTANNVTSSGDTIQNDDILAHDVEFRKRNCELGLSKAYARHYRCKGSACLCLIFYKQLDRIHVHAWMSGMQIWLKGSVPFKKRVDQLSSSPTMR